MKEQSVWIDWWKKRLIPIHQKRRYPFAFVRNVFASLFFTSCGEQVCSEISTQSKEKSHFLRFSFESFKGLRALFSVFDQSVAFIS